MTFRQFFRRFGPGCDKINESTSFRRAGRDQFLYQEGDHKLLVFVELLLGPPYNLIYPDTVKRWEPPHEMETISRDEKERILKNIYIFFDERGISYGVHRK
jgi:hypothetical protein